MRSHAFEGGTRRSPCQRDVVRMSYLSLTRLLALRLLPPRLLLCPASDSGLRANRLTFSLHRDLILILLAVKTLELYLQLLAPARFLWYWRASRILKGLHTMASLERFLGVKHARDLVWAQATVDWVEHILEVIVGLYDGLVVQVRTRMVEVSAASTTCSHSSLRRWANVLETLVGTTTKTCKELVLIRTHEACILRLSIALIAVRGSSRRTRDLRRIPTCGGNAVVSVAALRHLATLVIYSLSTMAAYVPLYLIDNSRIVCSRN